MGDKQERTGDGAAAVGAVLDRPEVAPLEYVGAWAREQVEPVHVVVRGVLVLAWAVLVANLLSSFSAAMWMVRQSAPPPAPPVSWAELWGFPTLVVLLAAVPSLVYRFRMTGQRLAIWMALACTVGAGLVLLRGDQYVQIRALMDRARLDSISATPYLRLWDVLRNALSPALCLLLVVSCRAVLRGQGAARREVLGPLALLMGVYGVRWVYAARQGYVSAMSSVGGGPGSVLVPGLALTLLMLSVPSHRQLPAGQPADRRERRFALALALAVAGIVWLAAVRTLLPRDVPNRAWGYEREFDFITTVLQHPHQVPFVDVLRFTTVRLAPMAVALLGVVLALARLVRPQRFGVWLSCCLIVQLVLKLLSMSDLVLRTPRPLTTAVGFVIAAQTGGEVLLFAVPTLVAFTLLRSARDRGSLEVGVRTNGG